jgi:hypothetical protein
MLDKHSGKRDSEAPVWRVGGMDRYVAPVHRRRRNRLAALATQRRRIGVFRRGPRAASPGYTPQTMWRYATMPAPHSQKNNLTILHFSARSNPRASPAVTNHHRRRRRSRPALPSVSHLAGRCAGRASLHGHRGTACADHPRPHRQPHALHGQFQCCPSQSGRRCERNVSCQELIPTSVFVVFLYLPIPVSAQKPDAQNRDFFDRDCG